MSQNIGARSKTITPTPIDKQHTLDPGIYPDANASSSESDISASFLNLAIPDNAITVDHDVTEQQSLANLNMLAQCAMDDNAYTASDYTDFVNDQHIASDTQNHDFVLTDACNSRQGLSKVNTCLLYTSDAADE